MAPAAFAQDTGASEPTLFVEIENGDMMVDRLNVSVDQLEDMTLYGADGEEIGEIDDVLGSDGKAVAVSVEVGGFLGVGDREAVVPLDAIELDGLRLTLPMARSEIEALPEWADG